MAMLLLFLQADDVLVCGCGNSELSAHMYDAGFTRITNVDSSRVVVDMMQDKYTQQEYPGMICTYRNLNIVCSNCTATRCRVYWMHCNRLHLY
jgi:hypothetical protein